MFTSSLGRWLEGIALVGFVVVNFAAVFVALWWGLGKEQQPEPREHQDKGGMTDQGVPYVLGPQRDE